MRRTAVETLERRLCLSAVRIVAWNTANGPDNPTEDAYFRTVFEAIGDETVGGRAIPPSIVALQETDNTQDGGNSIARIDSILEGLYPTRNYSRAVTLLDTGDDATGFVYDSDLFDLVSTLVVPETSGMQDFAHHILRGQFRPSGTTGGSDFYLYTTHLKAGSNSTDSARRTAEANAIRVNIDALGSDQDVVVLGDFNISGASEGAYQNFLGAGPGQLFDPIDSPGEWKNNFNFLDIHTQNPAINGPGGMDDRFDFQLGSAAVFDDEGLQYLDDSYRAFGNNGTHTFNSDITTGTAFTPAILSALAAASDHLPVVVDYEIEGGSTAGLVIQETDAGTIVDEDGGSDSYSITLTDVPTADVTVSLSTDGQTEINGQGSQTLTFTPGNALTPQTVVVTAVDDDSAEGVHRSLIRHDVMSTDSQYDGAAPFFLDVTVNDNDVPSIVISEIMYNPNSAEPLNEWVEIANVGSAPVDLSGWLLDDEDTGNWTEIPDGSVLPAGQVAVIHNSLLDSSEFRQAWSVPEGALVVGVDWASLANSPSGSSEILQLLDGDGQQRDVVNFDDDGNTWPSDNNASSIFLTDLQSDNNLGGNWSRSELGKDGATSPGAPLASNDIGSPGVAPGLPYQPPQVESIAVNEDQSLARSVVRSLTIDFTEVVNIEEGALRVDRLDSETTSQSVVTTVDLEEVQGVTRATVTFSGVNVESASGSLIDGNYRLTIDASRVLSLATGLALDGDSDDQSGGDYQFGTQASDDFFRLFGDVDGDRDVDRSDFELFSSAFGQSQSQPGYRSDLDFDADGSIESSDLSAFRLRLQRRI
ncbi:MAG: lamin tail domain-containing protein [Planctomycetota bacterium]